MRATCLLAAALLFAQAPSAQTEWREHAPGASVSYDVMSLQSQASFGQASIIGPSYGYSTSRLFSAHLLSARVPVSPRVTLLAEVPVVYRDYAISDQDAEYLDQIAVTDPFTAVELSQTGSQLSLGNPMVGAEIAFGRELRLDASLRIPSQRSTEGIDGEREYGLRSYRASDIAGLILDNERAEAYETGVTSLTVGVNGRVGLPAGISLAGRIAPVLSVTDRDVLDALDPSGAQPSSSVAVRIGSFVNGEVGPVDLGLGVIGVMDSRTGRNDGFYSGRDSVTGVVRIGLNGLPVRPGVHYRIRSTGYFNEQHILSLSLDVPLQ